MKNIIKKVEAIREELKKPIPEPQNQEEKKMATKKKGGKKVTKKSKRGAKKKVAKKKSGKKAADGGITLATLAKEAGINGQKARQKLRAAGIEREAGGRWSWKDGSKALKAARKAISA